MLAYGCFHINGGYTKVYGLFWKIPFKWMMTGGTPISGKLHTIPPRWRNHGFVAWSRWKNCVALPWPVTIRSSIVPSWKWETIRYSRYSTLSLYSGLYNLYIGVYNVKSTGTVHRIIGLSKIHDDPTTKVIHDVLSFWIVPHWQLLVRQNSTNVLWNMTFGHRHWWYQSHGGDIPIIHPWYSKDISLNTTTQDIAKVFPRLTKDLPNHAPTYMPKHRHTYRSSGKLT